MFGFGGGGSESQVPTGGKKGGVAARTDSSIDDEEAGRMRKELAARSKAKKAAEAARIKAENAELKKRFNAKTVEQRTDDNLDDEEAGRMRKVMADIAGLAVDKGLTLGFAGRIAGGAGCSGVRVYGGRGTTT